MKFTEEQYREIVEAWGKDELFVKSLQNVIDLIGKFRMNEGELTLRAFALANEQTREWAHEQYVEKEKRYVWHSKKNNVNGKPVRLFKDLAQTVRSTIVNFTDEVTSDENLTESEIREWGYDPERFDKEEVE